MVLQIVKEFEQEQIQNLMAQKSLPDFGPGDTLRVKLKVVEGTRERIQAYEGVCIARRSRGINSSFTVRKISYGESVERVFPLYSPNIDSIEVMRRGKVRRAKLYYIREREGKSARIKERSNVNIHAKEAHKSATQQVTASKAAEPGAPVAAEEEK